MARNRHGPWSTNLKAAGVRLIYLPSVDDLVAAHKGMTRREAEKIVLRMQSESK